MFKFLSYYFYVFTWQPVLPIDNLSMPVNYHCYKVLTYLEYDTITWYQHSSLHAL